jgi:hypothetical protein
MCKCVGGGGGGGESPSEFVPIHLVCVGSVQFCQVLMFYQIYHRQYMLRTTMVTGVTAAALALFLSPFVFFCCFYLSIHCHVVWVCMLTVHYPFDNLGDFV